MYTKVYCFGGIETFLMIFFLLTTKEYTKVYCFGGIETFKSFNNIIIFHKKVY